MVPVNDVSGYPMASVIYIAAAAGAATTSAYAQVYATSYVNISSLYDNAFRAIYKSSQILEQLYMGFENGLMRIYPYKSLEVYLTQSSICYYNNQPITRYDPRCRIWYVLASPTDTIQYTPPYTGGSTGKLHITVSKRVIYNNSMIGVIALDFSMTSIDNIIISDASTTKYNFLIDTSGNVISYPGLDRNIVPVQTIFQMEPGISASQLNTIIAERSITTKLYKITKNGESWNANVQYLSTAKYVLVSLYNNKISDTSADTIFSEISRSMLVGCVLIGLFVSGFLIIGTTIVICQSNKISKSVMDLAEILKKIEKPNYEAETYQGGALELTNIGGNFANLVLAAKAGEKAFMKGDLTKALELFTATETLMREMKNLRGLSICLNNKGCVLKGLRRYGDAVNAFTDSIAIVMDQLRSESESKNKMAFKATLSYRKMNFANLYKEMKQYQIALALYKEAMTFARESDNAYGIAEISGNMGQLYIDMNMLYEAKQLMYEAYEMVKNKGDMPSLQQAMLNVAMIEDKLTNYILALQWYNAILKNHLTLNPYVKETCINSMHRIFVLQGKLNEATIIEPFITYRHEKSDIIFVLDCSGSMEGGRIATCRQNILSIIMNDLTDDDNLSMFTFSNIVVKIFGNMNKKHQMNEMRKLIETKTNIDGGGTAYYDALISSFQHAHSTIQGPGPGPGPGPGQQKHKWCITLTDGEDNQSRSQPSDVKRQLRLTPVNLAIIAACDPNIKIRADGRNTTVIEVFRDIIATAQSLGCQGILVQSGTSAQELSAAFRKVVQAMRSSDHIERF
jgi:tetratricopeptide (TPR) repeat protein